jgi:hypothetical protein
MKRKIALGRPQASQKPIWAVVGAAIGAPCVLAAHQLGLFPILAKEPLAPKEAAEAIKISQRAASALLGVCTAWKLLQIRQGKYELTPVSEQHLLPGSPTYFGGALDYLMIANYPVYSVESVKKAILTNRPQVYGGGEAWESHEAKAEMARGFTRAMHSMSMGPALAWPGAVNLSKSRMMLDIAGGSGAHCIGAVQRWPKLKATVFDLAPVCEVAAEIAQQHGLSLRIGTHVGDMWKDPFPTADVHFYSQIFHDWPPEKCALLSKKSFTSLPSGGRIIVHEMAMKNDRSGPGTVAAMSVAMMLWTEGQQFTLPEISGILREAGFRNVRSKHTFDYFGVVTGEKP